MFFLSHDSNLSNSADIHRHTFFRFAAANRRKKSHHLKTHSFRRCDAPRFPARTSDDVICVFSNAATRSDDTFIWSSNDDVSHSEKSSLFKTEKLENEMKEK